MNRFTFTTLAFIFIALISCKLTAAEKLQSLPLASLAIHEKHQVPIFHAAVYANQVTDNATIYDQYTPIRMESRLLVDSYSSRQMHQMWVGAILINTPRAELKELADPFLTFSQLIKVDLIKGDHLVFDYSVEQGTKIILNGTLLGRVDDTRFQKALTAAWFGIRPPSKPFGQNIRKAPDSKAIAAFEQIQPSSQRIAQIAKRYAAQNQPQQVAEKAPSEPVQVAKAEVKPTTPPIKKQDKPKQEKPQPIKQPKADKPAATKQPVNQTPNKNKQRVEKKPTAKKPVKQTPGKKAPVKKVTPQPIKSQPKVAKIDKPPQESNDILDSMIATLKQDYVDEVTDYIESKARPKPPRNIRKLPKDTPRLKVTITRSGSNAKVTTAEVISGNFVDAIKVELKESVIELKGLPAFPDSIPDSELELLVTLDLSKCKRSTSAWICL